MKTPNQNAETRFFHREIRLAKNDGTELVLKALFPMKKGIPLPKGATAYPEGERVEVYTLADMRNASQAAEVDEAEFERLKKAGEIFDRNRPDEGPVMRFKTVYSDYVLRNVGGKVSEKKGSAAKP